MMGLEDVCSDFEYLLPKKVISMDFIKGELNLSTFYIVAVGLQGSAGYLIL